MSILDHETLSVVDAAKEVSESEKIADPFYHKAMLSKGIVNCHVWTIGDNYPMAFHVECELRSMGFSREWTISSYEHQMLGYGRKDAIKDQVKESIQSIVRKISEDFLQDRLTYR
ncbi:MAG: hypothetical protein RIC36_16025 [Rhodospirillales bacterium]